MTWIKFWPQVLLAALLAAALWFAHHKGFQTAFGRQQAVIEQMQAMRQADALAAEQAYSAKLAEVQKLVQAQERKTHDAGVALAKAQAAARKKAMENKQVIADAIEQDKSAAAGACIDGFGADGLRLYRRALGYAD